MFYTEAFYVKAFYIGAFYSASICTAPSPQNMALGTNTQNTPIQVRHRTPARSLRTMMIAQITMLKNGIVHARIGHQVCEASVHNQAASPESHNSPPVSRLNSKEPSPTTKDPTMAQSK